MPYSDRFPPAELMALYATLHTPWAAYRHDYGIEARELIRQTLADLQTGPGTIDINDPEEG